MRVLIAIAHPDDEVLGMGGTISKLVSQGHEVSVCVFTISYSPFWTDEYRASVVKEQQAVDAFLGIKNRVCLQLKTCGLSLHDKMDLYRKMRNVIGIVRPDRIYSTSWQDFHTDHQEVFRTVLVNSRPMGGELPEMFTFETPSSTEWGWDPFHPNHWTDISDHLEKKTEALGLYKSEGKTGYHPRSVESVERLARLRGDQIGVRAAEAFKVIRSFS